MLCGYLQSCTEGTGCHGTASIEKSGLFTGDSCPAADDLKGYRAMNGYFVVINKGIIYTAETAAECEQYITDSRQRDEVFYLLEKEHGHAQIMSAAEYEREYTIEDLITDF